MCLSCVGRVVEVDVEAASAVIDADGRRLPVSLVILDVEGRPPAVGDWVLVHTGFAVEVIAEDVALAELKLGRDVRAASEEAHRGK